MEAQVTRLEAIHVGEIHTREAIVSASLIENTEGSRYELTSQSGIRLWIDATHGGLMRIVGRDGARQYEWPGIRVVAHRGGVALGPPENTLPAINRAIEVGSDLIEVDIRETADGQLVLMHDTTVDRTTDGRGSVSELSADAIARLRVQHSGTDVIRVPLLSEGLQMMKGRIDADLDFKEGDFRKLIAAVKAAGMEDHVTMHSSWQRCAEVMRMEPRIRIRPTVGHADQVRDLIAELQPAMINFDWHAVTEAAVRTAHLGGCLAFVNCLETADTDLYVREAIRIGADYIQSDRPDRVVEILRDMGLRGNRGPILGSQLGTPRRHPNLGYPLR